MAGHLDKIDHLVVLMLENRSFDQMLGFLYADSGFTEETVPEHLLTADKETVSEPPKALAASQPHAVLTRGGPARSI
jgi:phospholipase C